MNSTNKVYSIVTQKILDELKAGTVPWRKPWSGGFPHNWESGREYRGINLWLVPSGEYLTFNQVKKHGGFVKKGAKSFLVVFWRILNKKKVEKDEKTGEEKEKKFSIPLLRYYRVFSLKDVEGIPSKLKENHNQTLAEPEKVVEGYKTKPSIRNEDDGRAFYSPPFDYINVPHLDRFDSSGKYYSTLFHECVHSTGHEKRLDRHLNGSFGNHEYSKEELVAEFGAAYLCGLTGIQNTIKDSASYIDHWSRVLEKDNTLIVHAAASAQKAVDYILGRNDEKKESEDSADDEAD